MTKPAPALRDSTGAESAPPAPFPRAFWSANVIELFERAAYYSMASFVVIYLGQLGLGAQWPSRLNGFLWFLVYFLPILSGSIADRVGFRRALLAACVMLAAGYVLMGSPVWWGGAELSAQVTGGFTATASTLLPIVGGILLIGIGGSIVKPCISGTVQKTHLGRATLAFAIFYMVINIGSILGRLASFSLRERLGLSALFAIAAAAAGIAFLVVFLLHRDPPEAAAVAAERRQKSMKEVLLGMVTVLGNGRFVLFLLVSTGFNFIYHQVYNVLPLYASRVLETKPAMELYTLANPVTIVIFQLLITRLFGKVKPIRSIVVGTAIVGLAMLLNLIPIFSSAGPRGVVGTLFEHALPMGSLIIIFTVSAIAFGELFTSSRTFEWVGSLAPKGQEGLFLGYANLPMALGSLLGGPVGAWIFHSVMARDAKTLENGLLELVPANAAMGWIILTVIGLASAAGMWTYNRWLQRQPVGNA